LPSCGTILLQGNKRRRRMRVWEERGATAAARTSSSDGDGGGRAPPDLRRGTCRRRRPRDPLRRPRVGGPSPIPSFSLSTSAPRLSLAWCDRSRTVNYNNVLPTTCCRNCWGNVISILQCYERTDFIICLKKIRRTENRWQITVITADFFCGT
jgi:hypothetical protein